MTALKIADIHNDFKRVSDIVSSGESVLISHPNSENIVVISEKNYIELEKIRRNKEYSEKIDKSLQQYKDGKIIIKTMAELEELAK